MICCKNCHHISHQDNHLFCDIRDARIANPDLDGCLYYKPSEEKPLTVIHERFEEGLADLEKQMEEFDKWRARCIRLGVRAGVIILIAYAAFVVWMLTW